MLVMDGLAHLCCVSIMRTAPGKIEPLRDPLWMRINFGWHCMSVQNHGIYHRTEPHVNIPHAKRKSACQKQLPLTVIRLPAAHFDSSSVRVDRTWDLCLQTPSRALSPYNTQ